MVSDHRRDVEVFNYDGAVGIGVASGRLVQEVFTLAGYLKVRLGDRPGGLLATLRALLATTHLALRLSKALLRLAIMARVGNRVPLGVGDEHLEANVEADGGLARPNGWRIT